MCESEVAQLCLTRDPHGLQPSRLLHPWDFPGKSTGVVPLPSLNKVAKAVKFIEVGSRRVAATDWRGAANGGAVQ